MNNEKNPLNFITNAARYTLYSKIAIGFILIGIGMYAAITLIIIVFRIFMDIESVPFMYKIISLSSESIELISNGTNSVFVSNTIISYIIAIILLLFAGGLTKKILSIGINLINKLEVKYLIDKLWNEYQKMKKENPENKQEGVNLSKKKKSNVHFK